MLISIGQPKRSFLILVCLLLPLFGSLANSKAQDNPVQVKPVPNKQKPAQVTETLTLKQLMDANDIAAIRARLGGGIDLEGLAPESKTDQMFNDSVAELYKAEEPESSELKLVMPPSDIRSPATRQKPSVITSPLKNGTSAPQTSTLRENQANLYPANANSAQQVLRVSARGLEDMAAELEYAQFYDKADELRKTATKYWLQARSMD